MELLIIFRFFVDFFWEFKFLNILHTAVICFFALLLFFTQRRISFKVIIPDIIIVFFIILCSISFLRSERNEDAILDYLKMIPLLFYYIIGRSLSKRVKLNLVGFSCILFSTLLFLSALLGYGYKYWGDIYTFAGGYFFKTDVALAVLIFLSFSLSLDFNKFLKLYLFLISVFIVFVSNSRISIPIILMIYFFSYMSMKNFMLNLSRQLFLTLFILIIGLSIFSIVDFSKMGLIGFDLSDPFSEKSTQGRSLIWSAIINYYNNFDLFNKIFGSGMASDLVAAKNFHESSRFESIRAHSTYLWLLVCTGWSGLISFLSFIVSVFYIVIKRVRNNQYDEKYLFVFICLSFIFLIMSVSVELIIRTQITYLLFFFAGLCCNNKIYNK